MRSGGQSGHTCRKFGKGHERPCRTDPVCYMCAKEGHFVKDFLKGFHVCFSYNQIGDVKDDFPLLGSRLVQALAHATLGITNDCHGKDEAPKS